MTLTTLVVGGTAASREAAIAPLLDPHLETALLLEGLPDGLSSLDATMQFPQLQISRIAPGCLCCTGNLTMRVTLNRLLRKKPLRLYIGIATSTHLETLRLFLAQPPYDSLLQLTSDLHVRADCGSA
ncbi:GTPase [Noviherbaspirillum saxi]|uniref:GTPase n=1 Tax=Noviherbaspirillum saxi TaxID=2320863 RepID=A0A3A3FMM0_9BURK|nr:GTPase [Noviherbaspirillum saxi]RJF97467.1 GTPase [Noviherbaspirillum saxi]